MRAERRSRGAHPFCDAVGNLVVSTERNAGVPSRTLILGYDGANRLTTEQVLDATYAPNPKFTAKVSIQQLQRIHAMTHPAEGRLEPRSEKA